MQLISVDAAARQFGVGRTTLFRWLEQGRLDRYHRSGDRHTLIDRGQLADIMRPRLVTTHPDTAPGHPDGRGE
jgi:excisionase family DNA binding protein